MASHHIHPNLQFYIKDTRVLYVSRFYQRRITNLSVSYIHTYTYIYSHPLIILRFGQGNFEELTQKSSPSSSSLLSSRSKHTVKLEVNLPLDRREDVGIAILLHGERNQSKVGRRRVGEGTVEHARLHALTGGADNKRNFLSCRPTGWQNGSRCLLVKKPFYKAPDLRCPLFFP